MTLVVTEYGATNSGVMKFTPLTLASMHGFPFPHDFSDPVMIIRSPFTCSGWEHYDDMYNIQVVKSIVSLGEMGLRQKCESD